jgi:2-polyprenyl-6-methoxyphenol hydroxylase-like FAD-dependent oxidoreductase
MRSATQHGFPFRFSNQLLSLDDSAEDHVVAQVRDKVLNLIYDIRCKYLFGADGARSTVVNLIQIPLTQAPAGDVALNILVRGDYSHLMKTRQGNLHYVIQPDGESPLWNCWTVVRMVKPWFEWMVIPVSHPACPPDIVPSNEEIVQQVKAVFGDDTVEPEVVRVDKWTINETFADVYSKGLV